MVPSLLAERSAAHPGEGHRGVYGIMNAEQMMQRICRGAGFVAALDQSGGSTPKTLANYGLSPGAWSSEKEMFDLIDEMRCRIITSPAFSADKILGTILFERTMDRAVNGLPIPSLLREKGIVPFLKVDQGLQSEHDSVELMKPITGLDTLLERAKAHGIFGTKMRSVIRGASATGIAAIVAQQFSVGRSIIEAGLLPILEPEYDLNAPDRAAGEAILLDEILGSLAKLREGQRVLLKLSLPVQPNAYRPLVQHPRVARVVALSGGYTRRKACEELAKNSGVIASFSRALLSDLRVGMSAEAFDAALGQAVDEIYRASVREAKS